MSNHKAINSDSESRREQPQGEATSKPLEPSPRVAKSDPLAKYARCDVVKRKAAQTEGGEKPPSQPATPDHWPEAQKFAQKGRAAQPAGGAREWRLRIDLLGVSQHDFWDDMRAQGYAAEQVRQRDEAAESCVADLLTEVTQLRQERDALRERNMTIEGERDMFRQEISQTPIIKELASCGLQFCDDLAEEGTPWEVAAEPEPQYFATLTEAIQFRDKLFAGEARERAEKELREAQGVQSGRVEQQENL